MEEEKEAGNSDGRLKQKRNKLEINMEEKKTENCDRRRELMRRRHGTREQKESEQKISMAEEQETRNGDRRDQIGNGLGRSRKSLDDEMTKKRTGN